ncbi:MAG TPA: PEP-CTERM sorting domain-containing protein [Acetobacteraceae bacterium]|nr:PEP-CTERM sorting domain-containing protein [Acetobacteraceae bacterium]
MRNYLLAAALLAFGAPAANATTIDFNALRGGNGKTFTSYTENGFTVSATSGNWQVAKFGNPKPAIQIVFGRAGTPGAVTVTHSATPFTFSSLDLANAFGLNEDTAVSYSITGFLGTIQEFTQSGILSRTGFVTVEALQPSTVIDSLVITEAPGRKSSSANIDNIVVQPAALVPEPVSIAMLGAGLMGVGFVRRKRA